MTSGIQWLTTSDLLDFLRVDWDNARIVESLALALPGYIETTTGLPADVFKSKECPATARQLGVFLVALWFNADGTDAQQLRQTIEALTRVVKHEWSGSSEVE